MLKTALDSNSMDSLPPEVKSKYTVKPFVYHYEITDALKQEAINFMNQMADLYESRSPEDEKQWPPRSFTRTNSKGNEIENTFFCNNLCNYRNTCIHLKRFNDQWALRKLDRDEFADLF